MVNLKNWKNGGVVGTFPRCKIDQFVFLFTRCGGAWNGWQLDYTSGWRGNVLLPTSKMPNVKTSTFKLPLSHINVPMYPNIR
jgi:hypothetical protein